METIVFVSGTRAEYNLMKTIFPEVQKEYKIIVLATNMHLLEKFGGSIQQIKEDGYEHEAIDSKIISDSKEANLLFLGDFIPKLTNTLIKINPKLVFIVGDRIETLGAAIVCAYLSIPICHFHGGEVTSTIDEPVRHAITKLSHIHFPPTLLSKERLLKMGENEFRIETVGSLGASFAANTTLLSKEEVSSFLNWNPANPLYVILQHPVTLEEQSSGKQIEEIFLALSMRKDVHNSKWVVIYPNCDPGHDNIIQTIEKWKEQNKNMIVFKNLDHKNFLSILKYANALLGNSSSGIIEAPSLKVPVINIGARQSGRERAQNIIDCVNYDHTQINGALNLAESVEFKNRLKDCCNPYYLGPPASKVLEFLKKVKIDSKLIQKQLAY